MRIKSSFKDYYDSVQKYGFDDLLYIRESKRINIPPSKKNWYIGTYWYTFSKKDRVRTSALEGIGFCGKLYPFIRSGLPSGEKKILYDIEEILDYLYQDVNKSNRRDYYDKIKWKNFSKEVPHYFHEAPVYHISPSKQEVIFNPCLRSYEFFRVMDAYNAYQELAMYLSNKANPEKPIPKIDDRDMVEIKGFNKFSFRKDKQQ